MINLDKLAAQSLVYADTGLDDGKELIFSKEKFAELIVEECIREIGYKSVELLDIDFYPHYQERLKKHFGVEE